MIAIDTTDPEVAALLRDIRAWTLRIRDVADPSAANARFGRVLDTLACHGWCRCEDHWRTPHDEIADAWEAIGWGWQVATVEGQL